MNTALATPLNQSCSLTGQVVLITGGGNLSGREYARAVIEAGGTAIIGDPLLERAHETVRHLDGSGRRAHAVSLTASTRESCREAAQEITERFGRIDVLVNDVRTTLEESSSPGEGSASRSLQDWEANLAVSLRQTLLQSQVLGGTMANNGGGVIVNVASAPGLFDPECKTRAAEKSNRSLQATGLPQSAIKGGLILLTRYLANYWAEEGVRVNSLCPAGVFSGQPDKFVQRLNNLVPLGKMTKADELRAALVFLAAPASSYMTGSTLVIDGNRRWD